MTPQDGGASWRPSADLDTLRRRAELIDRIRAFFRDRGVLEVETPLLARATVTDLHLHSLSARLERPGEGPRRFYLQTSPEFAMKRLLAAGSGPIFQICKAFRDGEAGRRHNPEFTLLEWYRPGFDHHLLMDEMDALLAATLQAGTAERTTYREAFLRHAGVDPHAATVAELASCARSHGIDLADDSDGSLGHDDWLHLLLSHVIEPELGTSRPAFLYDFPASQAALARVRPARDGEPAVAERFEVFVGGVELANGFHELTDAAEQRRRFASDLEMRRRRGLPEVAMDEHLLAALEHGLPPCAGVALGVDRLLMALLRQDDLRRVVSFDVERA